LEAIPGRHIRLPDPSYVFTALAEFQENSTDSSRLFNAQSNRKMLVWMKPYQQNVALDREKRLSTVGYAGKRRSMKSLKTVSVLFIAIAIAVALGCSDREKAPDVANDIRHALDQGGLNDVRVSQDRDKGVVTLGGRVRTDVDKARAGSIARSIAGTEVVSNEISVRPNGDEGTAKKVDSDLDSGIDKNLDAMLVQSKLKNDVRYDVASGVVTLKGTVPSQDRRSSVQRLAEQVPNVKQVVNELEVKHQRATSSE
jgi:hyperosmotically inducible periplasmic protein